MKGLNISKDRVKKHMKGEMKETKKIVPIVVIVLAVIFIWGGMLWLIHETNTVAKNIYFSWEIIMLNFVIGGLLLNLEKNTPEYKIGWLFMMAGTLSLIGLFLQGSLFSPGTNITAKELFGELGFTVFQGSLLFTVIGLVKILIQSIKKIKENFNEILSFD